MIVTWAIRVCLALMIGGFLFAVLGSGCDGPEYQFQVGQRVRHALDEREGIVLQRNSSLDLGRIYKVRFLGNTSTTDVGLLGADGAIKVSPYSAEWYQEFELIGE